ncbi:MAG: translation elongation factor Ts [Bacteroidales bacterium]|nr:translation elongation factor Ts [Bacteroidales bacterium]MDY3912137.1 translation elongation factor Ts [Sodaliphilus sp.]
MAVTIADIQKLRKLTGAGLVDCKKALIEAENDLDKAIELIRKRGQAIAAKREDRSAAEGVAFAKTENGFGAIVALKCETDFVASNEKFVALANKILDAAVAGKVKTLDDLKEFEVEGKKVPELITELSGITGEKMELGAYESLEAPYVASYNHFNKKLATLVGFNKAEVDAQVGKNVAMQVASMNPIAATREQIPQATIDEERKLAVEKTKTEQVKKAVENALKKAGFNLYIAESEEHLNEGIMKGSITEAQAQEIRDLKAKVAAEKEANLPQQMIENIANGRMNKFFQENVLMEQIYEADDAKNTVAQYLAKADKDLKAIDLKRINLNAD